MTNLLGLGVSISSLVYVMCNTHIALFTNLLGLGISISPLYIRSSAMFNNSFKCQSCAMHNTLTACFNNYTAVLLSWTVAALVLISWSHAVIGICQNILLCKHYCLAAFDCCVKLNLYSAYSRTPILPT